MKNLFTLVLLLFSLSAFANYNDGCTERVNNNLLIIENTAYDLAAGANITKEDRDFVLLAIEGAISKAEKSNVYCKSLGKSTNQIKEALEKMRR